MEMMEGLRRVWPAHELRAAAAMTGGKLAIPGGGAAGPWLEVVEEQAWEVEEVPAELSLEKGGDGGGFEWQT